MAAKRIPALEQICRSAWIVLGMAHRVCLPQRALWPSRTHPCSMSSRWPADIVSSSVADHLRADLRRHGQARCRECRSENMPSVACHYTAATPPSPAGHHRQCPQASGVRGIASPAAPHFINSQIRLHRQSAFRRLTGRRPDDQCSLMNSDDPERCRQRSHRVGWIPGASKSTCSATAASATKTYNRPSRSNRSAPSRA